ncbi:MAG: flagellar basal body rod C-terminal domain-containing protein [bacterium]|nr:flagellar basal body rod C-terminal domain-containing protein [bacterium]
MLLQGTVSNTQRGIHDSIGAMHMQMELMGISNANVQGFDKVGYQRKDAVVSSFAELIGIHALSEAVDDSVGRIVETEHPTDLAIANKGYFQILNKDGSIELTRDGRFKINEKGELLGLEDQKVLTQGGSPIVLPFMPEEGKDIKIDNNGKLFVFNHETRKLEYVDTVGVVSSDGKTVLDPDIKQGCLEFSNVNLAQEFLEMLPYRKNFDANRQLFRLQNDALTSAIQQLGGS